MRPVMWQTRNCGTPAMESITSIFVEAPRPTIHWQRRFSILKWNVHGFKSVQGGLIIKEWTLLAHRWLWVRSRKNETIRWSKPSFFIFTSNAPNWTSEANAQYRSMTQTLVQFVLAKWMESPSQLQMIVSCFNAYSAACCISMQQKSNGPKELHLSFHVAYNSKVTHLSRDGQRHVRWISASVNTGAFPVRISVSMAIIWRRRKSRVSLWKPWNNVHLYAAEDESNELASMKGHANDVLIWRNRLAAVVLHLVRLVDQKTNCGCDETKWLNWTPDFSDPHRPIKKIEIKCLYRNKIDMWFPGWCLQCCIIKYEGFVSSIISKAFNASKDPSSVVLIQEHSRPSDI
jgi:hypothetical protein